MTESMRKAIDFLRRQDLETLADGRYEIEGNRIFAMVQRYDTVATDAPRFEHHRTYIDVQFIVTGEEIIGWVPMEKIRITDAYRAETDIGFGFADRDAWSPVLIRAGQLAVFWPEDGHAPKLAVREPSAVMKIVVKMER